MSVGDWVAWGFFTLGGIVIAAIAAGWIPIGTVRSRSEARLSRQVIGWSALGMGVMLALGFREPAAWVAALSLAGGGVLAIRTARERSLADQVKPVRDIDLNAVARQYVFDSRPPARGRLEIHVKRGWTLFLALASVGLLVLIVGATWDILGRDHLGWLAKLLFIVGLGGFLLLFAVLPSLWVTQRALRGIPIVTLDSTGITMGRPPSRDPSIGWDEIQAIDVRVLRSGGVTDRLLVVNPREGWLLAHRSLSWRITGAISSLLYGSPYAISTVMLAVPFEEIVARIQAHRPGLLQPEDRPTEQTA